MWEGKDFPLPADRAVPAVVPFPMGASKQRICGPGHSPMSPPLRPRVSRRSCEESLCPKYVESPTCFLWPAPVPVKSFCSLRTRGGEGGSALLGFPHCCAPAKLPLAMVRISPRAADVGRGTTFHSGAESRGGGPVVRGCAWAPCWSTALDGRRWALRAGPCLRGPSFPPPGNAATCEGRRDATVLPSHPGARSGTRRRGSPLK